MPWMHTAASGKQAGELVRCTAKENCTLDGRDWSDKELKEHYEKLQGPSNDDKAFSTIEKNIRNFKVESPKKAGSKVVVNVFKGQKVTGQKAEELKSLAALRKSSQPKRRDLSKFLSKEPVNTARF